MLLGPSWHILDHFLQGFDLVKHIQELVCCWALVILEIYLFLSMSAN
jgi:hypothetical protein